jgi:ribosomal protein S18 acetylase RimI-like enzyme
VIYFKRVTSEADAEILRNVRNQCREFMTRHSDYITQEQQKEWFKDAHKKYELYIVYTVEHGAIIFEVGFGVIHKCDDCFMLTGGLMPDSRGKGFGKKVFKFLMDQCHKSLPIKLELLKNNIAAFKTYKNLGFSVVGENDRLIFMEYRYDSVI